MLCCLGACRSHSLNYEERLQENSTGLIKIRYYSNGNIDTVDRISIPANDSLRVIGNFTPQDLVALDHIEKNHGDTLDEISTSQNSKWVYFKRVIPGQVFFVVRKSFGDTIELGPFPQRGWLKIVADSGSWNRKSLDVWGKKVLWSWHK